MKEDYIYATILFAIHYFIVAGAIFSIIGDGPIKSKKEFCHRVLVALFWLIIAAIVVVYEAYVKWKKLPDE